MAGAQELKTDQDKTLYALGVALANQLAPFALSPAEVDMVKAGLTDAALNHPHKAEPKEYMGKIQELRTQRAAVVAAAEKKAGDAYVAKAAGEPGAKKLESGVIITALVYLYLGPYLMLLAIEAERPGPELLEPLASARSAASALTS